MSVRGAPKMEGRHVRGASLATKLTVVIALMVTVFMGGFALFLNGFMRRSAAEQLEITAFEAARTAAQMDAEAWSQWFATPYQGMTQAEIQAEVDRIPAELFEQRFLSTGEKAQRTWNQERLSRFADPNSTLLAIQQLSADGTRMVDGTYRGEIVYTPYRGRREARGQGVVEEGQLDIAGRSYRVIRGEYPILDRNGDVTGRFAAFIDARSIEAITRELNLGIAYIAVGFILAGAGLSFFMGRRIAKPLRQLQHDIRIVAGGELEHHAVPHSSDEIGELARSFNSMTRSLVEAQELEREAAASQHEVSRGAEVAQGLLPERLPRVPGFELGAHHEASEGLGGELYDVLSMSGGRYGLLVASASGSGVPAALVIAMARSTIAAVARDAYEPDQILREANALVSGRLRKGMYVSAMLAVLDPVRSTLRVANAGAEPLLSYVAADELLSPCHSEGIALGFDKGPVFDSTLKTFDLPLARGDRVVLASKGVAALVGADGKPLGDKRLKGLVRREATRSTDQFIKRVGATLAKFGGDRDREADVTLLTLARPAS